MTIDRVRLFAVAILVAVFYFFGVGDAHAGASQAAPALLTASR